MLVSAPRCAITATRGPATQLLLADEGERGAEVFVLNDRGLRDLTKLVKGPIRQVDSAVTDRQMLKHSSNLVGRATMPGNHRATDTTKQALHGAQPLSGQTLRSLTDGNVNHSKVAFPIVVLREVPLQ